MTKRAFQSIVVTGGAGFIGANFVREWLQSESGSVVNVDKLTYAGSLSNLAGIDGGERHHFFKGDIADAVLVGRLLSEFRPRAVVHLAAESHVDRSIQRPAAFVQTNVVGTFQLLETVLTYWRTLPVAAQEEFRFLHVSTDEVFGTLRPQEPPFRESSQYAPNSPYSASKAASDHFVRAFHHTYGLPVVTVNCSNNFGPFQYPEKLIPLMILKALAGKPLPVYGDGLQIRDWLYVSDQCAALRTVLTRGAGGESYNVGGRCEKTNLEVVAAICNLLDARSPRSDGKSYREQITFVADRPGHDRRYAMDIAKIEGELGWRPVETFETGLERTVRWYLANPLWVREVVGDSQTPR